MTNALQMTTTSSAPYKGGAEVVAALGECRPGGRRAEDGRKTKVRS